MCGMRAIDLCKEGAVLSHVISSNVWTKMSAATISTYWSATKSTDAETFRSVQPNFDVVTDGFQTITKESSTSITRSKRRGIGPSERRLSLDLIGLNGKLLVTSITALVISNIYSPFQKKFPYSNVGFPAAGNYQCPLFPTCYSFAEYGWCRLIFRRSWQRNSFTAVRYTA